MLCAPCNLKGSAAMTAIYVSRMIETNNRDGSMLEGLELCPSSNAEYAVHGEHLGVVASANREVDVFAAPVATQSDMPLADARVPTLLVVDETTSIRLSVARDILHEHGTIAVKDPSGK